MKHFRIHCCFHPIVLTIEYFEGADDRGTRHRECDVIVRGVGSDDVERCGSYWVCGGHGRGICNQSTDSIRNTVPDKGNFMLVN